MGPGNIVTIEIKSEYISEVFTGFGERGIRAETVADKAAKAALRYLAAGVPVCDHLADQLLPWQAADPITPLNRLHTPGQIPKY
jgi:RNA 3'-terminal phosphate cyclase (ATP)